jgi:peptidoglycan-associated lipoprotein
MIHFGFDDVVLHDEDLVIINAIGDYLEKVGGVTVTISGHCDERGTVEYNIALGDRRAQAAKEYLVRLGLDPARAKTISYGSARPIDPGHNESAWARNRRDEFQIEGKRRAAR